MLVSNMDTTTLDRMCRCCAAEGIFKDIKTSYHWMGEEEVYGDMLRECFDVKLASVEDGGICEVCITQLRNAANFKKQVLHTEKKFKRHLENRRFKPTEVKEEVSGDNANSSDDDRGGDDSDEDEDYVPEFEIPIKTESQEESKSRKRAAKASTSRAKKSKISDDDKSLASKSRGAKTTVSTKSQKNKDKAETKKSDARKSKDTLKVDGNKKGIKDYLSKAGKGGSKTAGDVVIEIHDNDDPKSRSKTESKRRSRKNEKETQDDAHSSKKKKSKSKKRSRKDDDVMEIHGDSTKRKERKKKSKKGDDDYEKKKREKKSKKRSRKDDDVIEIKDGVSKNEKEKKSNKDDGKKKTDSKRTRKDIDLGEKRNETSKSSKNTETKKTSKRDANALVQNIGNKKRSLRDYLIDICDDVAQNAKKKKNDDKKTPRKDDDVFEIHTRTRKDDDFLEIALTERDKHLHNIRTILMNSNATPIQNHNETGFTCGFCIDQFLTAAELKMHTLENHGEEYIKRFMGGANMYSYVIKLDITSLRCVVCTRKIFTLELLMEHLESKHDAVFHKDIKNHILPFKFQSDIFTCAICDQRFDRFQQMQWHMSVHYRNYECDECNTTFINKATLRTHIFRHRKGYFQCQFCVKSFDTVDKVNYHEKFVHKTNHRRNKCTYCDEFFTKYMKKMEHMVKVHGHKQRVVKCTACTKTFPTKEKLTKHTKRDHKRERNYKCDVCGASFFDNYDLRRHLRTHEQAKPFTCDTCGKGFNRKDNMLEHSRIHTGENKRFSCDRCGLNFPHMARLRRHTAMRHKEVLPQTTD